MKKELHDKAWSLLDEKGLNLGEKMMIRSHFASAYKNEYPFVKAENNSTLGNVFRSELKEIRNFFFYSRQEVILANAIVETTNDNFNPDYFMWQFKAVLRVLGVKSRWSE